MYCLLCFKVGKIGMYAQTQQQCKNNAIGNQMSDFEENILYMTVPEDQHYETMHEDQNSDERHVKIISNLTVNNGIKTNYTPRQCLCG